jgi:hypothetical protein
MRERDDCSVSTGYLLQTTNPALWSPLNVPLRSSPAESLSYLTADRDAGSRHQDLQLLYHDTSIALEETILPNLRAFISLRKRKSTLGISSSKAPRKSQPMASATRSTKSTLTLRRLRLGIITARTQTWTSSRWPHWQVPRAGVRTRSGWLQSTPKFSRRAEAGAREQTVLESAENSRTGRIVTRRTWFEWYELGYKPLVY